MMCARRYYWRYRQCKVRIHESDGEAIVTGKNLHALLAIIGRGEDLGAPPADDAPAEAQVAYAMASAYAFRFADSALCQGGVEVAFRCPVVEGADTAGQIDGLAIRPDGIWLVEHKSTAQITGDYLERLPMDLQLHWYAGWWPESAGMEGCLTQAVYSVIQKPTIRLKKTETMPEYCLRVADWYKADQTRMLRQEMYLNPKRVEQFRQYGIEVISRIQEDADWLPNFDACNQYGRLCSYFPLCNSNNRVAILSSMFEDKAPFSELPEDLVKGEIG